MAKASTRQSGLDTPLNWDRLHYEQGTWSEDRKGLRMIASDMVRVEYIPNDGEPVEVPATESLLNFLQRHGTTVGHLSHGRPRFAIYRLSEPLRLTSAGIPQPLRQLLISLLAGYGDGRLIQIRGE